MLIIEAQTRAKSEILKVIEEMRHEMHVLAKLKGLTHKSVLEMSMKIDEKVNEYIKIGK